MTAASAPSIPEDRNPAAITKPCAACKRHFVGVPSATICPDCERDSEFYRLARKRGDKRQFIPYQELFQQWKNRRAECGKWRMVAEQAAEDRIAREQAERERSYLLAVLSATGADLDPALALATELEKTRAELERAKAYEAFLAQRIAELEHGQPDPFEEVMDRFHQLYGKGTMIPADMHRRLIQLCHPDKHGGSSSANEVTRWLLEVRP